MDGNSQEATVEETSRDKTQRSLSSSSSSSSSLSTVSSTLNYDDCYIIANEKCMIEETRLHSRLG